MKILQLNVNWNNKLCCQVFTELRITDSYKVGDKVEVYLNDRFQFPAKIVSRRKFTLDKINNFISGIEHACDAKTLIETIKRTHSGRRDIDWSTHEVFLYLVKREYDVSGRQTR